MRLRLRMLGALLLGGATALLVSCGSSNGLLSSNEAGTLNGDVDAVSSAVSAGNCGAAEQRAANLRDHVSGLPGSVDQKLLNALSQGANTVSAQATKACAQPQTTQQTLQTQTQTTTTNTTPTTTTPTTPPATTPTTPTLPTETGTGPTGTSPNGGAGAGNGGTSGGGAQGSG
jgi:hypothetical protein